MARVNFSPSSSSSESSAPTERIRRTEEISATVKNGRTELVFVAMKVAIVRMISARIRTSRSSLRRLVRV